jgi:hypothetical protein
MCWLKKRVMSNALLHWTRFDSPEAQATNVVAALVPTCESKRLTPSRCPWECSMAMACIATKKSHAEQTLPPAIPHPSSTPMKVGIVAKAS